MLSSHSASVLSSSVLPPSMSPCPWTSLGGSGVLVLLRQLQGAMPDLSSSVESSFGAKVLGPGPGVLADCLGCLPSNGWVIGGNGVVVLNGLLFDGSLGPLAPCLRFLDDGGEISRDVDTLELSPTTLPSLLAGSLVWWLSSLGFLSIAEAPATGKIFGMILRCSIASFGM